MQGGYMQQPFMPPYGMGGPGMGPGGMGPGGMGPGAFLYGRAGAERNSYEEGFLFLRVSRKVRSQSSTVSLAKDRRRG